MTKLLKIRNNYSGGTIFKATATDLIDRGFNNDDQSRDDEDVVDQSYRIEVTRYLVSRLIGELHEAGVLSDAAIGRIACDYTLEIVEDQ